MLTADTYNVTTLSDVAVAGTTSDDLWSLREALAHSQADAGAEVDTIDFDPSLAGGRLTLSLGQLNINSNVSIEGLGTEELAISGNNATRVFNISVGHDVTIKDMTLTEGKVTGSTHGGGIYNLGNLSLHHVAVIANQSSSQGGGLYSSGGSVSIVESAFENNIAAHGAGARINVSSTTNVEVAGSTFADNTASSTAGGLYIWGVTNAAPVEITNSTFSGNHANQYSGGLRAQNGGTVYVVNSTITDNYAGVREGGLGAWGASPNNSTFLVHNSIIADNHDADASTNVDDAAGGIDGSSSYNLVGVTTAGALLDTADHNIVIGTAAPGLAPLGNYGGPTKTHMPLLDSLALDAGNSSVSDAPLSDQRGAEYQRGNDGGWDIGAVELQQVASLTGPAEIIGTSGNDTIQIFGSYIYVTGSPPQPLGQSTRIVVWAMEGDDRVQLTNSPVPVEVYGGLGDDEIWGSLFNDVIHGEEGADELRGDTGGDELYGGSGNDILNGHGERLTGALTGSIDLLDGGLGNDTYILQRRYRGITHIQDEQGEDSIDLSDSSIEATIDLSLDSDSQYVFPEVKLRFFSESIENVIGTELDDIIFGNSLSNRIEGGEGNDYLEGAAGNDTYVFSGTRGLGTDTIAEGFGQGSDTLDFTELDYSDVGIEIDLGSTDSTHQIINVNGKSLTLNFGDSPEIENVLGTNFDDVIHGNHLANVLHGHNGKDAIYGYGGQDTLDGGHGGDTLEGGAEDDLLTGGPTTIPINFQGRSTLGLITSSKPWEMATTRLISRVCLSVSISIYKVTAIKKLPRGDSRYSLQSEKSKTSSGLTTATRSAATA